MVDKKLLMILFLLMGYVLYIKPLSEDVDIKVFELNTVRRSILKERYIASLAKKVDAIYPEYEKIIKSNNSLFFSKDTSLSSDRSKLQQMLKAIMDKNGLELVNINWGEVIDKESYIVLPISFIVRGNSYQLVGFFRDMFSAKKIITLKQMSIFKYGKKKLVIRGIIEGFKLKGGKGVKG